MTGDDRTRPEPDRTRVKLTPEVELRYWEEKLGVSAELLHEAVVQVGDSPDRVFEYIRRHYGA